MRYFPETDFGIASYEALSDIPHDEGDDTSAHPMRAEGDVLDVDGGGLDVLRHPVLLGVANAARRAAQVEAAERVEKEVDRESAKAMVTAAHAAASATLLARGETGAAPDRRSDADWRNADRVRAARTPAEAAAAAARDKADRVAECAPDEARKREAAELHRLEEREAAEAIC